MDKRIIALLIIIAFLSIGIIYSVYNGPEEVKTNESTEVRNISVNAILNESNNDNTGQYGHCAICGKALSYSEAHEEYTQGKVCHDCAVNPYYQSGEGAEYANKKLYEAYPDEYSWMYEDDSAEYEYYDESYPDDYSEGNSTG